MTQLSPGQSVSWRNYLTNRTEWRAGTVSIIEESFCWVKDQYSSIEYAIEFDDISPLTPSQLESQSFVSNQQRLDI